MKTEILSKEDKIPFDIRNHTNFPVLVQNDAQIILIGSPKNAVVLSDRDEEENNGYFLTQGEMEDWDGFFIVKSPVSIQFAP